MDITAESFYGFTDRLSPMRRSKVEQSILTTKKKNVVYRRIKYHDSIYSYTEYCRALVKEGREFVEKLIGNKTEYRAIDICGCFAVLNKCRFDFCKYLRDCGFGDDDKAQKYLDQEKQAEIDRVNNEQKKEEAMEKERDASKKLADEYKERMVSWEIEADSSCPKAVAIARQYAEKHSFVYHHRLLHVLAILRHPEIAAESPEMKQFRDADLENYLQTHNVCSRKIFEQYTGLTLGKTNKDYRAVMMAWIANPVFIEDSAQAPKPKRTRRTPIQCAALSILEENIEDPILPSTMVSDGKEPPTFYLLNKYRCYHLHEAIQDIPLSGKIDKVNAVVNMFGKVKQDEEMLMLNTYKDFKAWQGYHPNENFLVEQLDNRCPSKYSGTYYLQSQYIKEAYIILGDGFKIYRIGEHMCYANSPVGEALIVFTAEGKNK